MASSSVRFVLFANVFAQDASESAVGAGDASVLDRRIPSGETPEESLSNRNPRLLKRQNYIRLGHAKSGNAGACIVLDQHIKYGVYWVFGSRSLAASARVLPLKRARALDLGREAMRTGFGTRDFCCHSFSQSSEGVSKSLRMRSRALGSLRSARAV